MRSDFIGIDPGRKGGIALIRNGNLTVWPMPPEQNRGIDLRALEQIVAVGCCSLNCKLCLEWNTCRPNEVPDYAMRFGIQSGELRAMFFARGFDVDLVSPAAWMNKLGVPGKEWDRQCAQRIEVIKRHFPDADKLWTGPKGGIQDGIVEAICLAIYCRTVYSTPIGTKAGPRPPKFRGVEP